MPTRRVALKTNNVARRVTPKIHNVARRVTPKTHNVARRETPKTHNVTRRMTPKTHNVHATHSSEPHQKAQSGRREVPGRRGHKDHAHVGKAGGGWGKDGGGSTGKAQIGSISALSEDLQFIDSVVRKEVGRSAGQMCAHVPGVPPMISMLSSTTAGRSAFFGNLVASFNRQDYPHKELLVIIC